MIYLFDRAKKLQKIIPRKHIINATQTKVRNGIYQLAVEVPIFYEDKKGTHYNYQKSVSKAEFAGHYDDKNRFQLYKIYSRNITANEQGEFLLFDGVHIFFDEAKAMGNIHDRRFRDSEAKAPADVAFNSIGWTVIDYDVTDRHDINFYRASVTDAWNDLISTYGIEFDYELQFDGRKIISKNIIMKKQIGKWTGQRFAYGTNVLTLTQEQDESEVYTAAVGRGRGEESGDGFGPRLEFGDIAWSKDGITKPIGQNYIELPSATAEYGFIENGIVKPRIAPEVIFEDIEDKKKLADSTYYWLLENCVPKATWRTEVARIGNLNLGDTVGVLYKAAGIIKRARVEKIEYNLLDPELSKLTLGDFHHFENRQMKRINADIKRLGRDSNDRITRIKNEWNAWIDNQFTAAMNQFEQNLIDQKALIEADRENMTNLIEDTRTEWTENFDASVAEAHRLREENYNAMSEYVNTTVDTTRTELGNAINASIDDAKLYAEQQAQAKAEAVRTDLETVTSGHQQMIDSLQDNVINIDDFIGDKTVGLNDLLYNERMFFEERINSINTWHYNLLRETQSLDSDFWEAVTGVIETDSNGDSYYRSNVTNAVNRSLYSKEEILFEAGETYTLSFQVQTYGHRSMDYVWIMGTDSTVYDGNYPIHVRADEQTADTIHWGGQYRTYYITFTMPFDVYGRIRIGGSYLNNELGAREYRIKKPYLTQSDNKQWLHNPEDSLQNLEEVTRRVTLLEDGREEFITKTQYNFETGEIEGSIKNIIETVDESTLIMQNHENWILTNGASIERTVDGFESKAWLSDIHNPNIIPYSAVHLPENYSHWTGSNTTIIGASYQDWLRVRTTNNVPTLSIISSPFAVVAGQQYTVTWYAWFDVSAVDLSREFDYSYIQYATNDNARVTPTRTTAGTIGSWTIYKYKATFTTQYTDENATFRFGTTVPATSAVDVSFRFNRPKLEVGSRDTPYHNAFSNLSQRADELSLAVQGIDTTGLLSQSDIQIVPDYVQIGSQRLDGSNIGSLLRVSPTGIDMVAEAMRLSGDLYVDGDITALAIDAIEGNFARLFANNLTADVINGAHIKSNTIEIKHLTGYDAILEVLMARTVFSNEVTAKVGNYIDINAGNIVTAGLSANVIEADHIQMGTALVDKMFATSARIDQLITKTHFVNEMHALTLNVVDLNASQIRTRLLSANTIEASWIKSGTALLDRVFSSTAMFERMMAKSAFVTTLSAITLDLHELTIWRPDGVAVIQNGMQRFGLPVTFVQQVSGGGTGEVAIQANYWETNARGSQQVGGIYTEHAGRWLNVGVGVGLRADSDHASTKMAVVIRPSNIPSGASWPSAHIEEFTVYRGSTDYYNINVPLGRPTFGAASWTLEFYRIGDNNRNPVQLRRRRIWVSA